MLLNLVALLEPLLLVILVVLCVVHGLLLLIRHGRLVPRMLQLHLLMMHSLRSL